MFNNHTMSVVTDMNFLLNIQQDYQNYIVATITQLPLIGVPNNIYYAGILYPPTELLMEWADGNNVLAVEYPKYLMSGDCDDMIVALIGSVTQNNVILYIPQDEFNIFGRILLDHIYYLYGVVCNTPTTQFYVVPEKLPLLTVKFYLLDLMDGRVFLESYPENYNIPDAVLIRLSEELAPYNSFRDMQECRQYFDSLRGTKKKVMFKDVVKP